MNKVGRPISKLGRIKIGLSIDGKSNDILNDLVKLTGKTKSRLFEEAILLLNNQEIKYKNHGVFSGKAQRKYISFSSR